ncbi:MAG TPA: lysylphosphatidylglycerol synthase transmembrane domain-containing protein [Anaerolineales bacterium]|nr:lysylphosphatidylglycerol synthase transmembrane domain-containing protein [Anaerolineales bacterium]
MRRWQLWLGIVISLVFLALALRGLRLQEVLQAVRDAEYLWLIPGIAAYFVGVYARAWRWHYLLRPIRPLSTRRLFPIVTIGYLGNNIFPVRAGEILRLYVLKRDENVGMASSLATILVERAFDGIVMLGFVFLNLPRLAGDQVGPGVRGLAIGGAILFLGATAAFVVLAIFPTFAARLADFGIERVLPWRFRERAHALFGQFLIGLAALRSPLDVLMVLATSIVIWLLETLKYWFVMHAFPFQVDFFTLMLMNGVVNLATTLPSAPGYVGTFDAPGIAVLEATGVNPEVAAAYTFVLHAALWLPVTLLGAYYMLREGLSWRSAQQAAQQERLA